jgi:helicase
MGALIRYDLPAEIIALWQQRESETLLPLQELAVKQYNLFGEGNLLIQAPTSSGKTFIGEMAAIQTALRRKKVVYLVPLKALAEEKFRDFEAKYRDYGLKVIVATRDRREYDADLESGNFSIAVVVYEKLSQLLVRRPERLAEIDLVIADELEILSDPERGAMAELLLTRLRHAQCRLIGLSAVLGGSDRLAAWMDAQLVYFERRPVELRFGVLQDGVFQYRTYNELGEGREPMAESSSDSPWEVLTENVGLLARQGESSLIFVKAKHEARRGAAMLAERITLPAAVKAMERLGDLDRTRARDYLLETLQHGIAFHNADLAPEERAIVEDAFRAGEVKVLVSTSTLAVGLNLPAQNVFLSAEKWRYDPRLDIPWKTPLLHGEYENMGGRAGRYGAGHAFGRSILIATTPFDHETLWRRYIEGEREPIEPQLDKMPLEDHVLGLVASRCCRTIAELIDLLESTLTGRWVWGQTYPLSEIEFKIRAAVNRCLDAGVVVSQPEGRLDATPFGRATAAKGLSIATARAIEAWIQERESRDWADIDLLYAAASAPDGRMLQVTLTTREYEQSDYPGRIRQLTRDEDTEADTPLNRLRASKIAPFFDEVRAVKVALMMQDWLHQHGMHAIEERYNTMAGQVLSVSDQMSWLVDATAAIATAAGADARFIERIEGLRDRLPSGILPELLPLARLRIPALTRGMLLDLHARNQFTSEALAVAPLPPHLPKSVARALQLWARENSMAKTDTPKITAEKPQPAHSAPVLVVDDRNPGGIQLDGERIALQEKQFRLMRLLAAHPGECVPYETIYNTLWGANVVVEDNQMHFQKRVLLDRIKAILPQRKGILKTVPKRGFMLQLAPDEIALHTLVEAA